MQPRTAVAVAFTTQALAVGATLGPISLFVQPVAAELAASLAVVGAGASLIYLMMALSGMVVGRFIDRGHTRRVMLVGGSVLCLALLAASRSTSLLQLGACCIAIGSCIPMLGPLSGSSLVGKVVVENRGRALGLMNIGAPTGSVVFALVAGALIESLGWRSTLACFGGAVGLLTLPTVALLVPSRVLGDTAVGAPPGLDPGQLLRTPDFRFIAGTQGIAAGVAMGWAVHLAPYLQGLGASTPTASAVIAGGSGLGMLGGLAFGSLVDRRHPRNVMLAIVALQAAGFGLLSFEPRLGVAIAAAVSVGFVGGGILPTYTTLLAGRFGTQSLGRAFGLTNVFMLPFGLGLPPLAGFVVSRFGSYTPALLGVVGLFLVALSLLSRVREDR